MLHQWNYGYAPQSLATLSDRLQAGAISQFKPKVLDGTSYMGYWDRSGRAKGGTGQRHPLSYDGPADLALQVGDLAAFGISTVGWANLTGEDSPGELQALRDLLAAGCTTLELDIEPFPSYYTGSWEALVENVATLTAEGATIWIDCPITSFTVGVLPGKELAPYVALWLGQCYWNDIRRSPTEQVDAEADYFTEIGARAFGHILPANDPPCFDEAVERAVERGAIHIGLWSLNTATTEALAAFRAAVMAHD